MKLKILSAVAVVLAIAASSFTTPRATFYYLIYNGSGTEKNIANYVTPTTTLQSHSYTASSPAKLNWFRATDANDNGLSDAEFNSSFETYDQVSTLSNLLSDEAQDVLDELDLENKILP